MWVRELLAGACVVGGLTGCALVDPVDSRYDTIGRSLAKARNESIFLNLVRASHDYPLDFVTISSVSPSLTNTSTFGLPSFLLGPSPHSVEPSFSPGRDAILGNTTASNATAISNNFSVSTQETSAFYEGFLKPVDLQTLDYFIRQGYSRELLYWLFTESVEFDLPDRSLLFSYNPPDDYGCPMRDRKKRCFREFVWIAMYSGLTVEQRTVQKPGSGGQNNSSSDKSASKAETTVFARFCFDPLLAESGQNSMDRSLVNEIKTKYLDAPIGPNTLSPKCGSDTWDPRPTAALPQPDTLDFSAGPIKFKIKPRSAFGIFEFLGTLIKMQRDQLEPRAYYPRPEELALPTLVTVHDDRNVLNVVLNGGADCFSHTWFNDGDYCVPEDAANTKRIFNLLAQLIAIETAATDLSITPVVRVIQ